jgi:GntR family transcriptional regulator
MIEFQLNTRSGVPAYLQVAQQVKQALLLGRLIVGDQLPTVREVVASIAINPNTVFKAYRELEREGLVSSRPGQGTFVTRSLRATTPVNLAGLRRGLRRWLERAYELGLDEESILALFSSTLQQTEGHEGLA